MNSINRRVRWAGLGACLLVLVVFAQLNYIQVFHASALQDNPLNTRHIIQQYSKHCAGLGIEGDDRAVAAGELLAGQRLQAREDGYVEVVQRRLGREQFLELVKASWEAHLGRSLREH